MDKAKRRPASEFALFFFKWEGYTHLAFLDFKGEGVTPLSDEQKLKILTWFEFNYGNTGWDYMSAWATEFSLMARNILHDGALIINPVKLDLTHIVRELCDMLTPDQREVYMEAFNLPDEELAAYAEIWEE